MALLKISLQIVILLTDLVDFHLPVLAVLEVLLVLELLPQWNVHEEAGDGAANNGNTESDGNGGQLHQRLSLARFAKST